MKKYNFSVLLIFVLGLFVLSACVQEDIIKQKENVVEGIPTTVTLQFTAPKTEEISTRGLINQDETYKVYDLYVFVFNASGKKEYGGYQNMKAPQDGKDGGSVTLAITSGKKQIYAIANIKKNIENKVLTGVSNDDLSKVSSLADMKNLSVQMTANKKTIERTEGHLLMSGSYVENNDNTVNTVNIAPTTTALPGKIVLKHADSEITFVITAGSGVTFKPTSWKVVNIPAKTYVYEHPYIKGNEDAVRDSEASDYFNYSSTGFDKYTFSDEEAYTGGSFSFYMMENRKKALNDIASYVERERQSKDANYENGDYIYAHKYATYVELKGFYTGKDKLGGKNELVPTTAEVTYTIHLGYADGTKESEKASDFRSLRNRSYTYKVKVAGVNNIILEVVSKENEEPQPGAEGQVVQAKEYLYFDSHYNTSTITFNKDKISPYATFRVKTPYDDGTKDAVDYKWVHFMKNQKDRAGSYQTDYEVYPGREEERTDANSEGKLMDIKQVIEEIQSAAKSKSDYLFDKKGNVIYTVFVDEFYYEKNPSTSRSCDWHDFVNKENREMHILCDTKSSSDKESSLTTSSFLISQQSIKTFYSSDAETAWGVETTNETGRLYDGTFSGSLSSKNGRDNTFKLIGYNKSANKIKWNKCINLSIGELNDSYNKAKYACLLRNRDLNGDKVIDASEIRWYLPAIDQLTGLWMGKDGLPSDVHLFKNGTSVTKKNLINYHFISSDGVMFWAEEGSSTGHEDKNMHDYRCVRNLGMTDDDVETTASKTTPLAMPADYVTYNAKTRVFTLSLMNASSLRDNPIQGELTIENENHTSNKPYKSFKIAESIVPTTGQWSVVVNANTVSPCASYSEDGAKWRMPNQRELSLMNAYAALPTSTNYVYLWSRTSSSLSYKDGYGYGIGIKSGIVTLPEDMSNTNNAVRCVHDVEL